MSESSKTKKYRIQRNWMIAAFAILLVMVLVSGLSVGVWYLNNVSHRAAPVAADLGPGNAGALANDPTATPNPVVSDPTNAAPPADPAPFVWDGTFNGLNSTDEYYIDGDPNVVGWKTEKAEMSYTCTAKFGVYISMDPGVVQGVSTGESGAAVFIPCSVGNVVKFSTPYWTGEPDNHQNTHLVEIVKALPSEVSYRDLLLALQKDDKKPVALLFANDGTHETINSNTANPAPVNPASSTTPFVWDGKFSGAAEFYIDGDPNVVNWKDNKKPEMSYVCTKNFGVFITMDPGSVQGVSTGEFGAVAFVPCSVGQVIKLTTSFWSTSALHWQTHLVEIVKQLPDALNYRDLLLSLKTADGKPIALFFAANGTYETIK